MDAIRIAQLEEAVALYRGKFLEEFFLEDSAEFEDWVLVQREALHRRALDALATPATYYEQRRDFAAARGNLARQLELDPWYEEAHRQGMRALALDGQTVLRWPSMRPASESGLNNWASSQPRRRTSYTSRSGLVL